jgi:hypothetical protein
MQEFSRNRINYSGTPATSVTSVFFFVPPVTSVFFFLRHAARTEVQESL